MEKIKIISNGVKYAATLSIFNDKGVPVETNKGVKDISKKIFDMYPDTAKDIFDSFELGFDTPESIILKGVEPSLKFKLLEEVANLVRVVENEKKKVNNQSSP